tara:strand:+ start:479 stop:658 length:180 start_codon:yes stop_codon:yes gene_type:complete
MLPTGCFPRQNLMGVIYQEGTRIQYFFPKKILKKNLRKDHNTKSGHLAKRGNYLGDIIG